MVVKSANRFIFLTHSTCVMWKDFLPEGVSYGNTYKYQDITFVNRNSLQEREQDSEVRRAFWNIQSKDIVIDVGAGFGAYTLCALGRGADFVFAFEANKDILKVLRENIAKTSEGQIRALEQTATCDWFVDKDKHSIDRWIERLSWTPPYITWLKIDADFPLEILEGAKKTIDKYLPNIIIRAPETPMADLLTKVGYKHGIGLHDHIFMKYQ